MWTISRVVVLIFCLSRLCFAAVDDDARIKVHCGPGLPCGKDITLDDARQSYSALKRLRTDSQEIVGRTPSTAAISKLRSLGNLQDCNDSNVPNYWAPLEEFEDGQVVLRSLISHGSSGVPFENLTDKSPSTASSSVEYLVAQSADSVAQERHLMLCETRIIASVAGPPRFCATVAILSPDRVWLRGSIKPIACYDGYELHSKTDHSSLGSRNGHEVAGNTARPTGAIDIQWNVLTKTPVSIFSKPIKDLLSSRLKMMVDQDIVSSGRGEVAVVHLTSTATLRNSSILSGWREALDFDIDLRQLPNQVTVSGTAHVAVCQQALGELVEYNGMTDAQRGTYAAALDRAVGDTLIAACRGAQQVDSKTIYCPD
jgi:hypothetical protein